MKNYRPIAGLLASLVLAMPAMGDTIEPAWAVVTPDPATLTLPTGLTLANTRQDLPMFANDNAVRSLACNPVTGNVLVPRTNGDIFVLNSAGAFSHKLRKTGVTGVTGGTFAVCGVGVAEDGVVYAGNLSGSTTTVPTFKLYRWANDKDPDTVVDPEVVSEPSVAFTGDPATSGNNQRWGDTLDVKGSGVDTKVVIGARNTAFICIFTTTNGTTFTPRVLPTGGTTNGILGLAFGPDITGYDDPATTGVVENLTLTTVFTRLNAANVFRTRIRTDNWTVVGTTQYNGIGGNPAAINSAINGLGTDPAAKLLGGISTLSAGAFLYDIQGASPSLVDSKAAFTAVTNTNASSNADIFVAKPGQTPGSGGIPLYSRLYTMNTNNAIVAYDIKPSLIGPTVVTPPANTSVISGWKANFSVTASGSAPLGYVWFRNDVAIPGATNPSYILDPVSAADTGAVFKVTVSNAVGPVTSTGATLTVTPRVDTGVMTAGYKIPVDTVGRPYLTSGDTQRGLAYNPAGDRLMVISRAGAPGLPNPAVVILNAADGSEVLDGGTVRTLLLRDPDNSSNDVVNGTGGATNGFFALSTLDCDSAGVIYGCNLAIVGATGQFKIYRWENDGATTTPTVAYGPGDPFFLDSAGDRAGEHIKVRGSGLNTQILVGARNQERFAIFTTADGLTFTPTVFFVPDARPSGSTVPSAAFFMCDFGAGDTIWAKADAGALLRVGFDVNTGVATIQQTITTANIPSGVGPIAVDPVKQLLGGIHNGENPNNLRLYNYNLIGAAGGLLDLEFFSSDNTNGNRVGAVDFGNNRIYSLDTSNGLVVQNVNYSLAVTPELSAPTRIGNDFSFTLTGTPGATYVIQSSANMASWTDNGTATPGPGGSVVVTRTVADGRYFFRAKP